MDVKVGLLFLPIFAQRKVVESGECWNTLFQPHCKGNIIIIVMIITKYSTTSSNTLLASKGNFMLLHEHIKNSLDFKIENYQDNSTFVQTQVQRNSYTCLVCTLGLCIFYQTEAVHTVNTRSKFGPPKCSVPD